MKSLFALIAAAGCILTASAASADSLYGTQVTLTGDYPNLGTHISNSVTKTIGSGVEFPSGSLVSSATGIAIIGVNIDVGMSTIDFDYTQGALALSGPFNGYVFDFSGATITSASLDPSSTFTPAQVAVGFGPNQVTVNAEGLGFSAASHILVDLTATVSPGPVSSAAPEPQSYALLLVGLGFAGWAVRRKPGWGR